MTQCCMWGRCPQIGHSPKCDKFLRMQKALMQLFTQKTQCNKQRKCCETETYLKCGNLRRMRHDFKAGTHANDSMWQTEEIAQNGELIQTRLAPSNAANLKFIIKIIVNIVVTSRPT